MIHFKLTKKNVKRLVTTMLLIAPIVYLFGSLFTGLNGAHGREVFATDEVVFSSDGSSYNSDFISALPSSVGSFPAGYGSLQSLEGSTYVQSGQFVFSQSASFDSQFSYIDLPDLELRATANVRDSVSYDGVYVRRSLVASVSDLVWADDNTYSYASPSSSVPYKTNVVSSVVSNILTFAVKGTVSDKSNYFYTSGSGFIELYRGEMTYPEFYEFYKDVRFVMELSSYIINQSLSYSWNPQFEVQNGYSLTFDSVVSQRCVIFAPDSVFYMGETYSDNIFGNFFSRDNFVSKIGEDVLSDDPHGFAPFASMLKFVDENMLNIGSLQVGLMAYGYFYWCAHVLLLMVLFDLTTFFITWVSHIGDKFGGNADE